MTTLDKVLYTARAHTTGAATAPRAPTTGVWM